MAEPDWDSYRREDSSSPQTDGDRTTRSPSGLWGVAALLAVAVAIAVYVAFLRPSPAPVATTAAPSTAAHPSAPPGPLGGSPDDIDVPPLDQTDAIVRRLVGGLSASAVVNTWLSGSGLIRNLVASTVNLEEGASPAKRLSALRPNGSFRVVDRGGRQVVDPRSYQRYDAAADAIVGMDPSRVARLYATLKPRIEEAYRDLGFGNRSFDRALQTVIVTLVRTPVPDDQPLVVRRGRGYAYVDDTFEHLTAAQKQFLRMGPRNVRRVDAWLRQLADALGIPAAAFSNP